jgi:hypothetical protein
VGGGEILYRVTLLLDIADLPMDYCNTRCAGATRHDLTRVCISQKGTFFGEIRVMHIF